MKKEEPFFFRAFFASGLWIFATPPLSLCEMPRSFFFFFLPPGGERGVLPPPNYLFFILLDDGQKEEKEKKLIERKERRFCLKNYKRYFQK